jgi:hypothetical protein
MSADAAIPRPDVVQEALRKTTERLAHELGMPTEVTPSWSEFEWRAARAAAAIHGVGPLLASSLRWRGPPGWQTFLAEQRDHTESRHRRIESLSKLLDERSREAGIPLVALKGAALHSLGFYEPGERPMADLDFLVEEPDLAAAARLLEDQCFSEELRYWKNRVFTPAIAQPTSGLGEHRDNYIKIELHWRIREKLPLELTDISEFVFPASPHPGINRYPSRAALLMHLVLHAAGAMASRELRLVHLHDLALVSREMLNKEWEEILCQGESGQYGPWWFLPPLQLTLQYYPDIVPSAVLWRLRRGCPARLSRISARRILTDVSLSSVWIHAFQGIEWSRSAGERVKYMLARVRPDDEARAIRQVDAKSARWACESGWHGLSQKSRIVRWISSRPTRSATMYAIREALAQPH